ncbi:hypothetical protein NE237_031599 [Protea cynaroides]|uniref:Uncharacterized protein n=1 Tax=Protea cynaroides TaxID=273540 RepID=A0A9Q0L1Q7_9MAGN|nr:hypothetical protein NE237_031599 [Protea cynaroides]
MIGLNPQMILDNPNIANKSLNIELMQLLSTCSFYYYSLFLINFPFHFITSSLSPCLACFDHVLAAIPVAFHFSTTDDSFTSIYQKMREKRGIWNPEEHQTRVSVSSRSISSTTIPTSPPSMAPSIFSTWLPPALSIEFWIQRTINALKAVKECGLKLVVVTSSITAIVPSPKWPSNVVKNEDCWTDLDYCKQKGVRFEINLMLF